MHGSISDPKYPCLPVTTSLKCFYICIVVGGVQLGQLGTAATNRPIVPAPDDYDVGEIGGMIGRGNRSTRKKPAPMPLCAPQTPTCCPDANPGRRGVKPAANHLSYGTADHFTIIEYVVCESL
jgi:hypothetical protein